MILEDFHTHTIFCDGDNSPEEMVVSAIEKGVRKIGLLVHAYVEFDDCCIKKEDIGKFKAEIARLREKYKEKIQIFCGVEMDYYSSMELDDFDYVIGSVHYIKCAGEYIAIDTRPEHLKEAAEKYFGGDIYAVCEAYYTLVGQLADKFKIDIIGHFDLITKFCEKKALFDTNNPRYIATAKGAIDKLLKHNIPFEINTGAISRKYKTAPYPSVELTEYIAKQGGKFILSSDSHNKDTLCSGFDKWEKEYKKLGADIITANF